MIDLKELAALITRDREGLLSRWREQVRQLSSAKHLDTPTLNDHVPTLLDELAAALHSQSEETIPEALRDGSSPEHGCVASFEEVSRRPDVISSLPGSAVFRERRRRQPIEPRAFQQHRASLAPCLSCRKGGLPRCSSAMDLRALRARAGVRARLMRSARYLVARPPAAREGSDTVPPVSPARRGTPVHLAGTYPLRRGRFRRLPQSR